MRRDTQFIAVKFGSILAVADSGLARGRPSLPPWIRHCTLARVAPNAQLRYIYIYINIYIYYSARAIERVKYFVYIISVVDVCVECLQLECCGSVGPSDYHYSSWFNHTPDSDGSFVPLSCCSKSSSDSVGYRCQFEAVAFLQHEMSLDVPQLVRTLVSSSSSSSSNVRCVQTRHHCALLRLFHYRNLYT